MSRASRWSSQRSRSARPRTGTRHFGIVSVSGRSRVPRPAARRRARTKSILRRSRRVSPKTCPMPAGCDMRAILLIMSRRSGDSRRYGLQPFRHGVPPIGGLFGDRMKVLVTGACGYKGSVLVPKLLEKGHDVVAFDIMWFGNFLRPHPNMVVVAGDVRETDKIDLADVDAIIHLSSVANDPCGDLDPTLTWEISCLATMQLADRARRHGIERFIYASSGSVYGVCDAPQVTEDLELAPISAYNKTKMCAERIVLSYQNDMVVQIVRPATVW